MSLILPTQGSIKAEVDLAARLGSHLLRVRLIGSGLDGTSATDTDHQLCPLEELVQTTVAVVCRLLRARLRRYLFARAGALARDRDDLSQVTMYELLVHAAEGFELDAHASWCATRPLWARSTIDNPNLWLRWCLREGLARMRRLRMGHLLSAYPPERIEEWIQEFVGQVAADPHAL
jgi:hypothetical protein